MLVGQCSSYLPADNLYVLQVEASIPVAGCSHADHDDIALMDRSSPVRDRPQIALLHGLPDKAIQALLDDGATTRINPLNLLWVHITSNYLMPLVRQASSCHRPDVAEAEHTDLHVAFLACLERPSCPGACVR